MGDSDDDMVFSLQSYAEMCAEAFGVPTADRVAIAARHGVNRASWERGVAQWTGRLGDPDSPLSQEFRRLIKEALERSVGPVAPVPLDRYVEISARCSAGQPAEQVLAEHHLDARAYSLAAYEWMVRGDQDKRLKVYVDLRFRKRFAELTHQAPRSQFVVLGPGNLVRARRCPNCGALKASKPLTAYIYCDYCATCFDYDASIEFRDSTALDSDDVDRALGKVIADELVAAFRAGDRAAYARTFAWQIEVSIEICPVSYSPRIKDPAYRRRLIDDVLVPWAVLSVFEPRAREGGQNFRAAYETAVRSRRIDDILALFGVAHASWEYEAELFERHGLFARHPDGYDREMYLFINSSIFVRPWLAVLADADQTRLLTAAGVACQYIPAPEVAFSSCGCGVCGRKLQIPAGATRMLCEACGHLLELGSRQFRCRECGASLSLPASGQEVVCAFCQARWLR
jgi:hypothetical protein